MQTFKASVLHDDWKGTVAADNAGSRGIHAILREKGLMSETDFLIGIDVYIGENHGGEVMPPYITALLLDGAANYESAAAALRSTADPIQNLKKVSVEITLNEFLGLFKRFSIALSPSGLDITGREYIAY